MGLNRAWTDEEKTYLDDMWGSLSIDTICKKLNRSKNAVMIMKNRLGLGRFLEHGDYITYSQLLQAIYGIDVPSNAYREMKRGVDFPVKKKRLGEQSYKIVYLDDFWKWAENHKRLLDFSKMEENILGAEPAWAKRKRHIDYECRLNTKPWTMSEDSKLQRMIDRYKYTYTDMAISLYRSEGAVKRRLHDLGIKGRPIRAVNRMWTDEEIEMLISMYTDGYSFEKIGLKLRRSALCCRGKMERIENPDYFVRENRRRREQMKEAI